MFVLLCVCEYVCVRARAPVAWSKGSVSCASSGEDGDPGGKEGECGSVLSGRNDK